MAWDDPYYAKQPEKEKDPLKKIDLTNLSGRDRAEAEAANAFLDTLTSEEAPKAVEKVSESEPVAATPVKVPEETLKSDDMKGLLAGLAKIYGSGYKPAAYPEDKTPFTETRPTSAADIEALRGMIDKLSSTRKEEDVATTSKETTSRLIDAIGKIAAGLYGQHTKTDMGGVKTELPSFKEEFERTKERYKEGSDLAKEAAATSSKERQMAYEDRRAQAATKRAEELGKFSAKEKQGEFSAEQQKAYDLANLAAGVKDRAAAEKQGKLDTATQMKQQQRVDQASKDILAAVNDKKIPLEAKAASIAQIVQNTYGIPAKQVETLLAEKGGAWFGMVDSIKEPTEQLRVVSELLQGRQPGQAAATTVAPTTVPIATQGTVSITHKATGQTKQYPANDPKVKAARANPDFEVK